MTMTAEDVVLDRDWIKQSFCIPSSTLNKSDASRSIYSSSSHNFTSTRLGGNICINNPPQYTEWADPPPFGARIGIDDGETGRYYGEAHEATARIISMRFGVAEPNSMSAFFTGFYDNKMATMARTGESAGVIYSIGNILGTVIGLPFIPITYAIRMYKYMSDKPFSKYYYVKPLMNQYWNTVNLIINRLGIRIGMLPAATSTKGNTVDPEYGYIDPAAAATFTDETNIDMYRNLMPGIFNNGGTLDAFAIATRPTRVEMGKREKMRIALEQSKSDDATHAAISNYLTDAVTSENRQGSMSNLETYNTEYWGTTMASQNGIGNADEGDINASNADYTEYNRIALEEQARQAQAAEGNATATDGQLADQSSILSDTAIPSTGLISDWASESMIDYLKAELLNGAGWLNLRVKSGKTCTESVQHSVGESDIAGKLNGITAEGMRRDFNFMGGNLGDGMITGAIESVIGAFNDFAAGTLDGIGASGLAIFKGRAFADIPKQYLDSVCEMPSMQYEIHLNPGYGNKFSLYTQTLFQVACLFAAAFPRSTGRSSYTGPFLCELSDPGSRTMRTSMIESINIERGIGEVGWSVDNLSLDWKITINVIDLTSMVSVPISQGNTISALSSNSLLDDVSAWEDYLACLAGMDTYSQFSPWNRLKLRYGAVKADWDSWWSPERMINYAVASPPGRVAKLFYRVSTGNI